MAFSICFNVLEPVPGAELCVEPLFAFEMLRQWGELFVIFEDGLSIRGPGFSTVAHRVVPQEQLAAAKVEITKLPFVEG